MEVFLAEREVMERKNGGVDGVLNIRLGSFLLNSLHLHRDKVGHSSKVEVFTLWLHRPASHGYWSRCLLPMI